MAKKKSHEPILESLAIAVPPELAWEALTTPRHLSALTLGRVEMDPVPGKPFLWRWDVWAAAAPGKKPPRAWEWRGKVLDAVPGSTLVLGGKGESLAVLTVKGQGAASLVTVVQSDVASGFDIEEYRYGWADFLLRMKTRLEGPPAMDSIYLRTLVRARAADVLRAWLSSRAMGDILPGKAKIAGKQGGRFLWEWKEPKGMKSSGEFLEISPKHRVSFTWESRERHASAEEVVLSAEETPYGALVSLEHRGGGRSGSQAELARQWPRVLERLRAYFFYGKRIRTT